VPNPGLEAEMGRYRLKIEKKFNESFMNHSFKMPKLPPQPLRISMSDGVAVVDPETVYMLTKRCNSQLEPSLTEPLVPNANGFRDLLLSPLHSNFLDSVAKQSVQNTLSLSKKTESVETLNKVNQASIKHLSAKNPAAIAQTRIPVIHPTVTDFDDNYGGVILNETVTLQSQRMGTYRNPTTSKSNQVLAQSRTIRGESQNSTSNGPLSKIYSNNNMAKKFANNSGRHSNERVSNDSSSRVPFHHRLPSGKSRQQAIRAKTKIYAHKQIVNNSSVVTPSSQVGSTKNANIAGTSFGQNVSKGNISIKSSNAQIQNSLLFSPERAQAQG